MGATLFTISATVRSVDGHSIAIRLDGHEPVLSTEPDGSAAADAFVEECSALGGMSMSDLAVPVSRDSLAMFGSSLVQLGFSGTPAGATFIAPVDLLLGGNYASRVAAGDGVQPVGTSDSCTSGYQITTSGSGWAIVNYESGIGDGSGPSQPDLWAFGRYGFALAATSDATIEECVVTIAPSAQARVDGVFGWDAPDRTPLSCAIGYVGE